ncbi:MAG: pectate lyase, partial [Prevotella sp.]|nr:pectate lyase [Prevotella sp.]
MQNVIFAYMKRLIIIYCWLIAGISYALADTKETNIIGDVNGDSDVNVADVMLAVNYILGNESDKLIFSNTDINNDNTIDVADVMSIVSIILYGDVYNNVVINEAKGWLESAYVKWEPFPEASSYAVYIRGGQYEEWTKLDNMLVRNYGTYGRADMVGLKASSDYAFKVVPVLYGKEDETKAGTTDYLDVKNYSREGFAHKTWTKGVGAYNNDGTLKSNAKVLYVTKNTAKTIKCSVKTSGKGTTECTGLQHIISGYQKGYDTTPLAIRIIGMLEKNDLDSIGSKEEGLQIKGNGKDSELNFTIEGIGEDACVRGFGFLVRNSKSVEFRNFAIIRCMDDGLSLDTDNSNIWIHHMDVFYGPNGGGDHSKGDGAVDVKSDSKYITVNYCHYWDTGKTNMFGMKSESGPNYISYDHNWFDHSDSRHPRVRTMSVHVWNNYFDNVAKYGVGATVGASVFVENNYFLNTKKPILISEQGTDALGSGTFSGESGGMVKAFGNYFDRKAKNFKYYTQNNATSTGYDAYEVDNREEQVPESEKTRAGGFTYNNFDTDDSIMYPYSVDAAEDVPDIVKGYYGAGRLNHGDISYTFADNVGSDDQDSAYDPVLGALIDGYKSSLIGIFGGEDINSGGENGGDDENGESHEDDDSEGTTISSDVECTFNQSGTPSNNMFTVVNGNGSNSKGYATVNGTTYTTCLKLETETKIQFTTTIKMEMTLVFGSQDTKYTIKVD